MSLHPLPMDGDGLIAAGTAKIMGEGRALLSAHRSGEIIRLRRGVYVDAERHAAQRALDRYRSSVLAAGRQRRRPVFAGQTAALLHGLPIIGVPDEIVLLSPSASGRRRNGVIELASRGDESIVERNGRRLTSIAETVIDVARTTTLLGALVVADAALHTPRFGAREPRCSAADLHEAYVRRRPFPRSRRVAAVLERASSDADTPLETLSRLRIEELGFPPPELQFAVLRPGRAAPSYLDFAWPEHGVWGEADGAMKYTGTVGEGSGAQRLFAEKRREDELRAVTGWRCARWTWQDAWAGRPLRDILRRAGLPTR
ncbi:hypothetical protein [Agromyces silvae]|uniref:hypothetical protein n=1 Tax=Agromyces silvae TaxID=3388266 RepID=UPI00280A7022|nr:hypothetical protein [Agromyces protaetiae]